MGKYSIGDHPTLDGVAEVMKMISCVIFPDNRCGDIAAKLSEINSLLSQHIGKVVSDSAKAAEIAESFIGSIDGIRDMLEGDVEAMYKADPAATSHEEIILCYPSIVAMIHHRVAHRLYELGVPIMPRMIAEIAHSKTGIDIHPAAKIGRYFAIDHGTGVVIGETSIIGDNVVIYQGVTLGARGFRYDENGLPINVPRHPIIEDNVKIYSNSSILGRITIGHDSIVGGNMWIDKDVKPNSKIVQR